MLIEDWKIDPSWTLFLDRDGVINERIFGGYITSTDEFRFKADVLEALSGLRDFFGRIIVVTNQQGVSKGLMTERNLLDIHDYMCDEVQQAGGKIDACFYALNLKGAEDDQRKPNPFMAEQARKKFSAIDFNRSVMVGDTDSDIVFGRNLGMHTILVRSEEIVKEKPDLEVDSLMELVKLLRNEKR